MASLLQCNRRSSRWITKQLGGRRHSAVDGGQTWEALNLGGRHHHRRLRARRHAACQPFERVVRVRAIHAVAGAHNGAPRPCLCRRRQPLRCGVARRRSATRRNHSQLLAHRRPASRRSLSCQGATTTRLCVNGSSTGARQQFGAGLSPARHAVERGWLLRRALLPGHLRDEISLLSRTSTSQLTANAIFRLTDWVVASANL